MAETDNAKQETWLVNPPAALVLRTVIPGMGLVPQRAENAFPGKEQKE